MKNLAITISLALFVLNFNIECAVGNTNSHTPPNVNEYSGTRFTKIEADSFLVKYRAELSAELVKLVSSNVRIHWKEVGFLDSKVKGDTIEAVFFWVTREKHPKTGDSLVNQGSPLVGSIKATVQLSKERAFLRVKEKNYVPNYYLKRVAEGLENEEQGKNTFSRPPQSPDAVKLTFPEDEVFSFVQEEAIYRGGIENLYDEFYSNLVIPEQSRSKGILGSVYVTFWVTSTGKVKNIRVDRGIAGAPELSEAAVKAVSKLKYDFHPALINKNPVNSQYTVSLKIQTGR